MLPVYRDGDRIIVSPAASVRRGDRVVVTTAKGEVMAKQLGRMTARRIELQSLQSAIRRSRLRDFRDELHSPHHLGEPVITADNPGSG